MLYSVYHLLRAAKKMGLRATTRPTYLKYEEMGVFKPGEHSVVYPTSVHRVFTEQEIIDNLARFKKYMEEKYPNRKNKQEDEK